ncbi:MAG: hypothetical protein ACXVCM_14275 [Ktedonobacteraceae bacterium]
MTSASCTPKKLGGWAGPSMVTHPHLPCQVKSVTILGPAQTYERVKAIILSGFASYAVVNTWPFSVL